MAPGSRETGGSTVVMDCSSVMAGGRSGDSLQFRFNDGVVAPARYDSERQCWFSTAPTGYNMKYEAVELIHADGEVACAQHQGCKLWTEGGALGSKDEMTGCATVLNTTGADKDAAAPPPAAAGVFKSMSILDRFLPVWIIAAMVLGVVCGYYVPDLARKLSVVSIQGTSLPIALGLWLMMWPVLAKVRYELLGELFRGADLRRQLAASVLINWLVGPALMTGLAWATLPDLPSYRNGVIMVGLARCIAMVLLWNQLAGGSPDFCAVLVAVNSILQIVLFSPLALFYLQVVSRQYLGAGGGLVISFWLVARSVLIFLGAPLLAAVLTRAVGVPLIGRRVYDEKFAPRLGPIALFALLYTVWVMFALQGHQVIEHIGDVCRVAVPMVLYFSIMWAGTLFMTRSSGVPYARAVTQAFTASSNNFELAIAVSVATFGVQSSEALAATVGPLIEVPVLLALVYVALWLQKRLNWE